MKDDYIVHNMFWKGVDEFRERDPHLMRLEGLPFVHESALKKEIPVLTPGIYMLTGGRQVGKSTLLKLIILRLLEEEEIQPGQIYYLPCETIADYNQLLFEIDQFRTTIDPDRHFILFIDEVSYVRDWDRAVKSLADEGMFLRGSAVITGSDTCIIKESMMKFPGRRGKSPRQDFHLYPLSFYEYVSLYGSGLCDPVKNLKKNFHENLSVPEEVFDAGYIKELYKLFNQYLITGGFMMALNDYEQNRQISPATYKTYIQWIVGDILKRNKQEHYLREIINALFPRLSSQVSWHSIAGATSIAHHQTISDYINILSESDVLSVLNALREDKLQAAPKKAKKISFRDPFVFHCLHGWIKGNSDYFKLSQEVLSSKNDLTNALTEGVPATLLKRRFPVYYIKAEGEVDIALVKGKGFLPIEIKNSMTIRPKDIKQIIKYPEGIIANTGRRIMEYKHLRVVPLPVLAMIAA